MPVSDNLAQNSCRRQRESAFGGFSFNAELDDAQRAIKGLNTKIIEHFSRTELYGKPAWLFSATCPSLRGSCRISIFRNNLRVWTSCKSFLLAGHGARIKLA